MYLKNIEPDKRDIEQVFTGSGLSELALKSYVVSVKKLFKYLEKKNIELTPESLTSYFKYLIKNAAPSTVNQNKAAIKKFLVQLANNHQDHKAAAIVGMVFSSIKTIQPETAVKEQDYLNRLEYQTFISEIENSSNPNLALIVKALFQTGSRVSELVNIRFDNVKLNGYAAIKVIGKGSKVRTVYMKKELYLKIKNHFDNGSGYLFGSDRGSKHINRSSITRSISKASDKSIIDKDIHSHTLRHSAAMYLLHEKKYTAEKVAAYLGHSSAAVTLDWYCHSKPTAKEILE